MPLLEGEAGTWPGGRDAVPRDEGRVGRNVFVDQDGSRPHHPQEQVMRRAAKAAGIRPWSPGAMRHTVTTWHMGNGAALDEMST